MIVRIELPFLTTLRLAALVQEYPKLLATGDPAAVAIDKALKERGIDITKIKIL